VKKEVGLWHPSLALYFNRDVLWASSQDGTVTQIGNDFWKMVTEMNRTRCKRRLIVAIVMALFGGINANTADSLF
jgi:hypothetical protein